MSNESLSENGDPISLYLVDFSHNFYEIETFISLSEIVTKQHPFEVKWRKGACFWPEDETYLILFA